MNKHIPAFFILFFWIICQAFAQISIQDSLEKVIASSADDTIKVNALNDLSNQLKGTDPVKSIDLATQARDLSETLNFKKGLATSYKYIGLGYNNQNMYLEAMFNWQEALRIFEEIGDKTGVSNILNNMGTVYSDQGEDEKALDIYLQSLQIAQDIEDKIRILTVSLNIGLIYQKKKATLKEALEYYFVALELAEELEYPEGIGYASVNIGEVYLEQDEDSTALAYFEKSKEALKNSAALPYPMINIGKYYTKKEDYEEAIKVQKEAFEIAEELNSKLFMAQALIGMAKPFIQQNRIQEAIAALKEAESLAKEVGSKESLKEVYEGLAKNSAKLKDFQDAFYYQELLTAINDSLFRSANEKRLNLMMATFKLGEKEQEVELQELTIQKQKLVKNAFLAGLLVILVIAFIILRNYLAKVKINKLLDKQNEEIEGLLLNILPEKVAKELQEHGKAEPRDYENVSVLFTDFVGFSSIAKTLDPNELVNELSAFFVAFDNITSKHKLEKIKTIGDAYMCAGGIPDPNETHALDTVMAGLEMQEFMKENNKKREAEGKIPWELRVGIHTGPIVAGVVGKKKYAYDIWGSTVNIASRMESNGEAGKVNISESTFKLINGDYTCHHRGKISAKNVGEIDMYFVDY